MRLQSTLPLGSLHLTIAARGDRPRGSHVGRLPSISRVPQQSGEETSTMKSESTPKRLRRLLSCTVAAVSALFASSAFSQANCPGAGNCCISNGSPGCEIAACCQIICAADPFCCNTTWDGICANAAQNQPACQCGIPGACGPQAGHNCFTTGGPGCTNAQCCTTVCAADPFCCNNSWDSLCVNQAIASCNGCGHPDAGDCCSANGTPFCNNRTCCEAVCAFDPFCCTNQWDGICASGAATVAACNCGPPPPVCPPSDHNCFTTGGPGCTDLACCLAVCAADPFCCNNSWDGLCVNGASKLCDGCGDPDAGDCCTANGTPFCNDRTCCESVCSYDPFCCNNFWDGICADEARFDENCPCEFECPESDDCCFSSHPDPGCNNDECCALVCAADPFCCNVAWDSLCAAGASGLCAGCRADFNGDGFVNGADLGLLLGAWGTADPCYDLNGDGIVNGADLGLLLGAWGACTI